MDPVARRILADGIGLESLCRAGNGRILRDGNDTGLRVNVFGEIREDVATPVLAIARAGFVFTRQGQYLGRLKFGREAERRATSSQAGS